MHVTYQAIKISSLSLLSSSDSNVEQFLCNLQCFHDTRPPSPPVFVFQFLKSSWRSLLLEARFLAWNSPNTVWRPGSARTRWGSLSAPPDPYSRNKGGVLLTGGEGKVGQERGREEKGTSSSLPVSFCGYFRPCTVFPKKNDHHFTSLWFFFTYTNRSS